MGKSRVPISCVYMITCIATNTIYVGSTGDFYERRRTHLGDLRRNTHINKYLQNAFNKYSESKFKIEVYEFVENTKESLMLHEQAWIDYFDAVKYGFNIAPYTVSGFKGRTWNKEHRARLSRQTKEWAKTHPNPCKGRIVPIEEREAKSQRMKEEGAWLKEKNPNFGKPRTEEQKQIQIKAVQKTYTFLNPVGEICIITNLTKYCRENPDESGSCNALKCGLQRVSQGKLSEYKGWKLSCVMS